MMQHSKTKLLLASALTLSLATVPMFGCQKREEAPAPTEEEQQQQEDPNGGLFDGVTSDTQIISYGDTFTREEIEYKIGDKATLVNVVGSTTGNGSVSAESQKQVYIKLPVTVKNVSTQKNTTSISGCTFYNSAGIEFSYPGSGLGDTVVFSDGSTAGDDITKVGNMRHDAVAEAFLYLLYNGDGHYYVDFVDGNSSDSTVSIEIDIEIKSGASAANDAADKPKGAGEGDKVKADEPQPENTDPNAGAPETETEPTEPAEG